MATSTILRAAKSIQRCFPVYRCIGETKFAGIGLHRPVRCIQTIAYDTNIAVPAGKKVNTHSLGQQHRSVVTSVLPSDCGFNDYEKGYREFKLDIPEKFNFSRDVIDKWADLQDHELANGEVEEGDIKHLAFWWTSETGKEYKWTFRQLSDYSKRVAYVLTGPCGLTKGDRIVVMLPSFPQYWLISLACIRSGITFIPSSTYHQVPGLRHRLQISKAKCIITDDTSMDKVDEVVDECPHLKTKVFIPRDRAVHGKRGWLNYANMYKTSKRIQAEAVETKSDEEMLIHFTTGTTGPAKMVLHTHSSYGLACVVNGRYFYDLTRDDIYWSLTDSGWAKSVWGLFSPWVQGACVYSYHHTTFDAQKILEMMEKYPVTAFTTSPPLWRQIVQEDLSNYDVSSLRCSFSGGELLAPEVTEKWEEGTGTPVRDGYGQTETLLLTANLKCIEHRVGSLGKPVPGCDVLIVDNEGLEVPSGTAGEIALRVVPHRPPGLFKGYLDDPSKTRAVFQGDLYLTGDMAYKDSDGYLWYVSRQADLIYTEGHVVSPFDVEHALMENPVVAECAVVSSPDLLQLTGQLIKAFVVLADDYQDTDPEELLDVLHRHSVEFLESWQIPKQIEFVDSLPTTVTGKLKRSMLRKKEWHMHAE